MISATWGRSGRPLPIQALFFASGLSGLIYESVWSHYLKIFVGHAAYAQTLVLAVFIGGLAVGSWLCARVADRLANPLRLYAIVEALVGLVAIVFHSVFLAALDWGYGWLLPATCSAEGAWCPGQWALAVALLAPQAVLLGATFPLVCSAVVRLDPSRPGEEVAALYFVNSLGAVVGVLASAFVLIPAGGLPGTLRFAGLVNLVVAMGAWLLSSRPPAPFVPAPGSATTGSHGERILPLMLAVAFLTGLSSFVYEVAWIRMLSFVLGAATHSFEVMLASFILGLALGGWWVRKRVDALGDSLRFLAIVQLVMGILAAATLVLYHAAFDAMAWMLSALAQTDAGYALFTLGSTAIALAIMLPATFCAGMTLPLITYRLLRTPSAERSIGLVYAANTVGALVGVALAVHLLFEAVGLRGSLVFGAAVDVGLGIVLLRAAPEGLRVRAGYVPAAAAVLALVVIAATFDIDPRRSASGVFRTGVAQVGESHRVAYHRDGKTASVAVLDDGRVRSIRTNGKPDAAIAMREAAGRGPTPDEYTMTLLALLPLGHAPQAKDAAIIGFGSGMSTTVMLASPNIRRVDTIEIEPAMVEGARQFRPVVDAAYADPRSHIVIDDAKSYFARSGAKYDIVVSEPSNPWVSGVASLFSEDFYHRVAEHMNEGAILAQWLHTYEMDSQALASILLAVSRTFPDFLVYSSIDTDVILIARKGGLPGRFDDAAMGWPGLKGVLGKLRLTDAEQVRRRAVAHWGTLGPLFVGLGAPVNSDYRPFVDQRAGKTRFTRAKVQEMADLQGASVPVLEMIDGAHEPSRRALADHPVALVDFASAAAWQARDLALGAGDAASRPLAVDEAREVAARFVRAWAACRGDTRPGEVVPALVQLAGDTIPAMDRENAGALWKSLAQSLCGRKLEGAERTWMSLLTATAARDAEAMTRFGQAILDGWKGPPDATSEYAFVATTTGLVARGKRAESLALFDRGSPWVRPATRTAELRLLYAVSATAARPPAAAPRSP